MPQLDFEEEQRAASLAAAMLGLQWRTSLISPQQPMPYCLLRETFIVSKSTQWVTHKAEGSKAFYEARASSSTPDLATRRAPTTPLA